MYLYYYIQIPLTCIPKTTAHSVYYICKVHCETHNCRNSVGKLKCQWILWLCKSASYGILSTNNLHHFRNNVLWKIQYKMIWTAVIVFTLIKRNNRRNMCRYYTNTASLKTSLAVSQLFYGLYMRLECWASHLLNTNTINLVLKSKIKTCRSTFKYF